MLKNKVTFKTVFLNIFISGFVAVFVFNFMISNIFDSGKIFKSDELLEMQFVDVEDRSWERRPLLNFWNKVFFSIPEGTNESGLYNQEHVEFIEFREDNSPDNFDVGGVAGMGIWYFNDFYNNSHIYSGQNERTKESFVIWSENGRDLRFTTQSQGERDFGSLGTSRLILHSADGDKTPISIVNSYLQFPGKEGEGVKFYPNDDGSLDVLFQNQAVFKIDNVGNIVMPIHEIKDSECLNDKHLGRILFNGEGLYICTSSGWTK
tara:strand:- start:702 stop:1490 length:789 start_codon:yes stop_codon:yes gene_type:complete